MTDTNTLPSGGTGEAMSTPKDDVDALAEILGDPDTDTAEDEASADDTDSAGPDDEEQSDSEGEDEDGSEDFAEDEPDEGPDGPSAKANGKFVADDGHVKLPDGSTITVKELKEGALRQSDYTRKMQSIAVERKTVEEERGRVGQLSQQLQEQHTLLSKWMEASKPQRPDVPYRDDPIAWGEYQNQTERWQEWVAHLKTEHGKTAQALEKDQKERLDKYLNAEREALMAAMPVLKDAPKRERFVQEVVKFAADFGFTEQEVRSVTDHRLFLVLRDAMNYRRMKTRAPEVRKEVEAKPRIIKGSRRVDPKQTDKRAKQMKIEKLRNEGTLEAGALSLMDII